MKPAKHQITYSNFYFSFSIVVLVPESKWIEETLFPAEIVMLFCCIYICWILSKAVRNKKDSALGFLFGFLFLFLTVLNDILFEKNIIKTEVYGPIGTFVLFFSQAFSYPKNIQNSISLLKNRMKN